MRFLSFAKVNLHLEVLRRRRDGFHELRTLFQTIDLADEIDLDLAESGVELQVSGAPGLPADESNLAWQAAARFLARWGRAGEGVRIRLRKSIPVGGGLGGGSANAASVLLGMCALYGREQRRAELEAMAAGLGSDVVFFLHGGTALGTGRGERIEPLADPAAAPLALWLAVAPVAVATSKVFAAHRIGAALRGRRGDPGARGGEATAFLPPAWRPLLGWNDLEPTCLELFPAVRDVYNHLSESGALAVRLSGSGATIFALFADRAAGEAAGARLGSDTVWLPVHTLSREEWRRRSGWSALSGGA